MGSGKSKPVPTPPARSRAHALLRQEYQARVQALAGETPQQRIPAPTKNGVRPAADEANGSGPMENGVNTRENGVNTRENGVNTRGENGVNTRENGVSGGGPARQRRTVIVRPASFNTNCGNVVGVPRQAPTGEKRKVATRNMKTQCDTDEGEEAASQSVASLQEQYWSHYTAAAAAAAMHVPCCHHPHANNSMVYPPHHPPPPMYYHHHHPLPPQMFVTSAPAPHMMVAPNAYAPAFIPYGPEATPVEPSPQDQGAASAGSPATTESTGPVSLYPRLSEEVALADESGADMGAAPPPYSSLGVADTACEKAPTKEGVKAPVNEAATPPEGEEEGVGEERVETVAPPPPTEAETLPRHLYAEVFPECPDTELPDDSPLDELSTPSVALREALCS